MQRLYKENYEKTKAKNHIPPDMLEILSARNTQSTISGINYRKYLHQWICLPDMQMYVQARKVNEQLSDVSNCLSLALCVCYCVAFKLLELHIMTTSLVSNNSSTFTKVTHLVCFVSSTQIFYKDDLNWLKGIGCYAWDTPEILRVKNAGQLQSEVSTIFLQ